MNGRWQTVVWNVISGSRLGQPASRVFDLALLTLILANVLAFVLGTVPEIETRYAGPLWYFEIISVAIFTVEYVLRLASCTADSRYPRPISGRIRFALTPLAIVDLLAVLPFYLPVAGMDLRVLRMFRVMRLVRILKLGRYSESLRLIGRVVRRKREELGATLFIVLVLLVVSSSVVYFAEGTAQPETFGSIPKCMWWGVTTLTTVGYGDACPVTPFGKIVGAVVSILGIGMFALPTGILGSAFLEELQSRKKTREPHSCPRCGHSWDS